MSGINVACCLTNACGLLRSLDEMSSREAATGTWGRSISKITWYLISCSLDSDHVVFCLMSQNSCLFL